MKQLSKDPIKVYVGRQQIEEGIRRSRTLCPVAMAIDAKKLGPAIVGLDYIEAGGRRFVTPPQVADAIMAFDEGRAVLPFTFEWPGSVA